MFFIEILSFNVIFKNGIWQWLPSHVHSHVGSLARWESPGLLTTMGWHSEPSVIAGKCEAVVGLSHWHAHSIMMEFLARHTRYGHSIPSHCPPTAPPTARCVECERPQNVRQNQPTCLPGNHFQTNEMPRGCNCRWRVTTLQPTATLLVVLPALLVLLLLHIEHLPTWG